MKDTCPNCGVKVNSPNTLCDPCDSEYLGTHIGGRMEEPCFCPICTNIKKRWEDLRIQEIKKETK